MKIAIKGHESRGKEVIQILESLGGRNTFNYNGDFIRTAYFIGMDYSIYGFCTDSPKVGFKLYTLEEFEKEFPFRVGDKVIDHEGDVAIITGFAYIEEKLGYSLQYENGRGTATSRILKPYKEMKETRNITLTLDKAKEWYKKGGELKEIALQAFTEKELTKVDLPKTWEEFCGNYPIKEGESYAGDSSEIYTHYESNGERDSELDRNMCPTPKSAEAHLAMMQLEQLRDCWRQGWEPTPGESYYVIKLGFRGLNVYRFYTVEFLSFPTREMAEEFLKCFRDLIEQAGDLI